jgi:uncharacterized protein YbaR (Trm112 family)
VKIDLMDIIVCPECYEKLFLTVIEQVENDIIEGSLHCSKCNQIYDINHGIPNLMPFDKR